MQFGKRAVRIDDSAEDFAVHFEDGTSEFGDVLVGAEGGRSVVRTHILQGKDVMKPLPLGFIVRRSSLATMILPTNCL